MTDYLELYRVERESLAAIQAIGVFLKGKDEDIWRRNGLRCVSLNDVFGLQAR